MISDTGAGPEFKLSQFVFKNINFGKKAKKGNTVKKRNGPPSK